MVLLNVEKQGNYQLKDLLSSGKIIQHYLDKGIMSEVNEEEGWDGYIHPSCLDWKKAPEKQFEQHLKKGVYKKPIEAYRRFRLGNLIHDDVQTILEEQLGAIREIRFGIEKIMFHGTLDLMFKHEKLGNVLIEFKSYSELQRDAATGSRIVEKFERILESHFLRNVDPNFSNLINRYHLFTDKEISEIQNRMMTKEVVYTQPCSDHMTQAFTYAWIVYREGKGKIQEFDSEGYPKLDKKGKEVWREIDLEPIDRICICYLGKSKFETQEFWYNLNKEKHFKYMKKAKRNYRKVLRELRRYQRENV